jgi:Carboxypeptidase regulatory-like domain
VTARVCATLLPIRNLIPIAWLVVAAAATAGAQSKLLGEVRDGGGTALTGAEVAFHPARRSGPACLGDGPIAFAVARPSRTRTDDRGRFRLTLSSPLRGALVITQSAGTTGGANGSKTARGALVCHPRSPLILTCRPLAELALGGTFDVYVQAIDPLGRAIRLATHRGVVTVQLPRGHYRLLLVGAGELREHAVRVRAGEKIELPPPAEKAGRTITLRDPDGSTIRLRHWPDVALPVRDGGLVDLPGGEPPVRLLVVAKHAGCATVREAWVQGSGGLPAQVASRIRSIRVTDTQKQPVPGARVLSVRRDSESGVRLDSTGLTDTDGRAAYDHPATDEATHLLVLARGFASTAVAVPKDGLAKIELKNGHRLRLRVFDPRGEPAANVHVEVSVADAPLLRAVYQTDGYGLLVREDLPAGIVECRIRSARMLAEFHRVRIVADEVNVRSIRAKPGFPIQGRVLQPGGAPATRALVTLRDTTGQFDVARTTRTAEDGSFRFLGLPEDLQLRLSAKWTGSTGAFISQQIWVQPGASMRYEVTMKREDPAFPGRRRGR